MLDEFNTLILVACYFENELFKITTMIVYTLHTTAENWICNNKGLEYLLWQHQMHVVCWFLVCVGFAVLKSIKAHSQ